MRHWIHWMCLVRVLVMTAGCVAYLFFCYLGKQGNALKSNLTMVTVVQ